MAAAPGKVCTYLSSGDITKASPHSLFLSPSDKVPGQSVVPWCSGFKLSVSIRMSNNVWSYHNHADAVAFVTNKLFSVNLGFLKQKSSVVRY